MNKNSSAILNNLFCVFLCCFCFLLTAITSNAQNKYWVFFKDKQGTAFNPHNYFDDKAIGRRQRLNISLFDITDFPLNDSYINVVKQNVDSLAYESRWFNAISVYADNIQIAKLSEFSFVDSIQQITASPLSADFNFKEDLDSTSINLLKKQSSRMGGEYFIKNNINGKGIRIAIFDGGFPNVDKSPAFEDIRKEGRIIKTWNFPLKKEFVYDYNNHGTMVMSCIGGKYKDINIGLATAAEFLLARTEINKENYAEEENWPAAMEWADKNGADIINSSLGYTYQRYFPEQMNGKNSLASRAADMAARKGILVVNAAGNEGANSWRKIIAPADADSIISVGGIDPATNYHIFFSSYGPTADKRMKPNVCAFGTVIAAGKNRMQKVQGTSFSSPLVAGFAACAWQTDRKLSNMSLKTEIEKSADLYPYFDYAHGFGVPQAEYFTNKSSTAKNDITPTFDFIKEDGMIKIIIKDEFMNADNLNTNLLFYNIQNNDGILEKYFVIEVAKKEVLTFNIKDFNKNEKINVHFGKYTSSYVF